jgi:hypothetical protein
VLANRVSDWLLQQALTAISRREEGRISSPHPFRDIGTVKCKMAPIPGTYLIGVPIENAGQNRKNETVGVSADGRNAKEM